LLREAIFDLTKGLVATLDERAKMLAFLRSRNCAIPNLQKGTVASWLRRSDLHAEARKLLELRAAAAHKPKVDGILRNVDPHTNRIYHSMTYANAGTGRLSSHSPNMQNLHREEGDTAGKFTAIMSGDISRIEAFGPVRQVLASCERALVAAEPGNQFFILDYSSIEYIIIAWLAGEQWVLDAFAKLAQTGEGDPYLAFGRECVGDVPWARDFGKAVILPRIFGVGENRLREALLAKFPDLDPDIDVRRLIDLFDKRHPRIRNFWDEILACAIAAIKRPAQEIDCGRGGIVFLFRDEFLTMRLPSGRYVSYPFASVIMREGRRGPEEALLFKENRKKKQKHSGSNRGDNDDDAADDDGLDGDDGRTAFLDCHSGGQPGFWGGALAENATQAVARDVMLDAVGRLTAAGYRIVLTVHDEIVAEVPNGFGSFDEFVRLALEPPDWASGMPVAGKARSGPRLAKADIPVNEWVTGDWSYIPLHKVKAPSKASGARKPKRSKPTPPRSGSDPAGQAAAADASWREEPAAKVEAAATAGETDAPEPAATGATEEAVSPDKASGLHPGPEGTAGNASSGNGNVPEWLLERERLRREQQQKAKAENKAPPPPPPPPPPGGDEFEDENEDGYPSWRRRSSADDESGADDESDLPPPRPQAGSAEAGENGSRTDDPKGPYVYETARGQFYICVERKYNSKGEKYFPQWRWGEGKWEKGTKGLLKLPYRLPELLDAPNDAWVIIAAGEKDVVTAVRMGFVATTNPGGEGRGQWTPELGKWFTGKKRVAIMEDNDKTGYAHALEVAKALRGIVPEIRIVPFRELSAHGDLTGS
jgi:DNA polymerase